MSNMSYCKFENTFHDLEDCAATIEQGELPSSGSERAYRKKLIQLCRDIVEQTEGEDDEDESTGTSADEGSETPAEDA
jgi:exonuclease VII small subunit